FNTLQKLRQGYMAGKITPERYGKQLVRFAQKLGIQNNFVKTIVNMNASKMGDVEMAMAEVHRQINERLAAKRPLSSYFRSGGSHEQHLRQNVAALDSYLDLLKRTLANQLTPDQVSYAFARLPQLA